MEKSKLIRVLMAFSLGEQKEFSKMLASPLHNHRRDVKDLYEIILKAGKQKTPNLAKEHIFPLLYPNTIYNTTKMDLTMSYLFQLVEQYLVWQAFKKDKWQQEVLLLKSYRKKGLLKDFDQQAKRLDQRMSQQKLRNTDYYQTVYGIALEKYKLSINSKPEQEKQLLATTNNYELLYLANALKYHCWRISNQTIYQLDYQNSSIDAILKTIEAGNYLSIPPINLYYHWYFMLSQPQDVAHFFRFKKQFFELGEYFEKSEKSTLLLMGINYCVRKINDGEKSYLHELLELYKDGLKNEYLLENNMLSRFTYHNIIGTAVATKNYEWATTFLHKYKPFLIKKERENAFSFNLARLEYHQKNYDSALQLLQKANYRDVLLNLAAKNLLLKIYVELDEDSLLLAHLDSMSRYIRRHSVIAYHKKNYKNIIFFAKKLITVNPFDKALQLALKESILSTKILSEKEWFLERLS